VDGMRRELARMRERVAGDESILLNHGSRYRYDRTSVAIERFKHTAEAIRADYEGQPRPVEPPEILRAVTRARNRRAAVEKLYPEWETQRPFCAYDLLALVETGELVPQQFAPEFPVVEEA
jgi:ribosomal protein L20A (L18A)